MTLLKELSIEMKGISKTYRHASTFSGFFFSGSKVAVTPALQKVDLEIAAGEIFALLGPNGAGKTTLMRILCGLVLPDAGEVLVCGTDAVRFPELSKRLLGFALADDGGFYRRLSGRENLEFFGGLWGYSRRECLKRIQELAERLSMDYLDVRYQEYSTGMKRWLHIVRALLTSPAVLLMDEPTRSLDPAAAFRLRELMKRRFDIPGLRALLFTTHQTLEAETVADRVAILHHGKIFISGGLEEIREKIGNPSASLDEIYRQAVNGAS